MFRPQQEDSAIHFTCFNGTKSTEGQRLRKHGAIESRASCSYIERTEGEVIVSRLVLCVYFYAFIRACVTQIKSTAIQCQFKDARTLVLNANA